MFIQTALEKWGDYKGLGKRPENFDDFWQERKVEVDNLGLEYKLEEREIHSRHASAYDLTFIGVDEAKIYAKVLKPAANHQACPTIFYFHGYHNQSGEWQRYLPFVAEGYAVIALDVRGQGGKSQDRTQTKGNTVKGHIVRGLEDGPNNLLFTKVYQDIYQLTQIAKTLPFVDQEQLFAMGGSQGGAQAIICAALAPQIRHTFAIYPFLSDFRQAYQQNVLASAYEELYYWFRYRDPLHEKMDEVFATLDYIDIQHFASQIHSGVTWVMALQDEACHPMTQFASYNQLAGSKEMLFYPNYGHEELPNVNDVIRQKLMEMTKVD